MATALLSGRVKRPERSSKEDDIPVCYLLSFEGY